MILYLPRQVDCRTLFEITSEFQSSYRYEVAPQPLSRLPAELQQLYSLAGRVQLVDSYWNDAGAGEGRVEATVWSREEVQGYSELQCRNCLPQSSGPS